ncbi:MAG: hypothetical protein JWP57_4037 [Spirosoma sp.]|nr:hypothetical protein [Spirosoma sp.]
MGVYGEAALAVRDAGLNPLPLAADAKRPAVRWKHWQDRRIPSALVTRWSGDAKLAASNIGTTTGGVTGLLLVDVDSIDPGFWQDCVARWGDTPAKVRTASGKLHLWYRSPGGIRNAQNIDGAPVDLRGDGGFAVLPPSVRDGIGDYAWLEGDLSALQRLPLPTAGSLDRHGPLPPASLPEPPVGALKGGVGVERGARNAALFKHLRGVAHDCQTESDLTTEGMRWNSSLAEPETMANVLATVRSVWGYKTTNRLIIPGGAPAVLTPVSLIDDLACADPVAFALYTWLRRHHAGVRSEFVISVRAVAQKIGWAESRVRRARQALLDRGLLVQTHQGGAGDKDAATFRFGL